MGLFDFLKRKTKKESSEPDNGDFRSLMIKKGCIEISRAKTPSGGDYAEAHYLDNNHNYTSKEKAALMVIKEYKDDGTMLNEIFMYRN